MAKSTAARAEARLKQLCCLGIGREAVMPALFTELHKLVPSISMLAFFFDDKQKLVGGYTDNPEAAKTAPLYMSEFHGRRGRELGGAFPDNVQTQVGVYDFADSLSAINVDQNAFDRSDFHNLIFRPQGIYWFSRLMVREGGRGRSLGSLTLYRGARDRQWTPEEKRRLGALEPFFAKVLRQGSPSTGPLADSGSKGLIIADRTGTPVALSDEGRRLLNLATHPHVTTRTDFSRWGMLPDPLVKICGSLTRIFADDPVASVPVYHHRNVWGGFRFEAQWLNAREPASGMIGITISHLQPLPLVLMRRAGELPLSRRQAEVCVLLANGASNETIAERLGISRNTAIAHGRWVYSKLDVHNRAELVQRLLAEPTVRH